MHERLKPAAIETRLIELWKALLQLETLGPDDHFLDLGGDSTIAMRMRSRIHSEFGIEIPTEEFFDCGTIRELTGLIGKYCGNP